MSDQELAAQIVHLRAHQEQTDQSLVVLAGALEDLIAQVESLIIQVAADSAAGTTTVLKLLDASRAVSTVRENHQSHRER
jgi:hypothetical protein